MDAQIYLIADPASDPAVLLDAMGKTLPLGPVAAVLLPRFARAEDNYAALVRELAPAAQARGAAVLIEGAPDLVTALGVDGLHVRDGIAAVEGAIRVLKPSFIVGAGDVRSRHDAMQMGEAGVDYILFGPLSGRISSQERELAQWWAETMETPGVLSDPEAHVGDFDAAGCEFIGLNLTADRTG